MGEEKATGPRKVAKLKEKRRVSMLSLRCEFRNTGLGALREEAMGAV
jgi:hypothetical protein